MTSEGSAVPWRHRLSLRTRMTVVTVLAVGVVVAAGGTVFLLALRHELIENADDAGGERAQEVVDLAAEGDLPRPLPVIEDSETYIEVVARGELVTASEGLGPENLFDVAEQPVGGMVIYEIERLPLEESGPYRVTARGYDTGAGPMTVLVAVSVEDAEDMIVQATEIAVVGLSGLVAALAALMWVAIGRTLAPVDAIRARADAITSETLSSRVPEPAQHDEIGRLARTVNQMLDRLEHSADRQRRFVADAAHELRSPIASLRVQLEAAGGDAVDDVRKADLLHETTRMQGLVEQLLVLARADPDAAWMRPGPLDLDDVIDTVVGGMSEPTRVRIDTSSVQPVQVSADGDLIETMVRNLVDNAVRHARSVVHVRLSQEGAAAVLSVDDDGPGVPARQREEIFGRFVRLDTSRGRDAGGVGLGLSIVQQIAHAHGGRVSVEEGPLGGACFTVELPTEGPASPGPAAPSRWRARRRAAPLRARE